MKGADVGMIWIWLVIFVVFLVVEAATMGLSSIWFALGALAALISSAMGAPIWLQLVWFFVISVVALVFTRPLAKKFVNTGNKRTNADRVLDEVGIVTEKIDNLVPSGMVSIGGKIWTARAESDRHIEIGTEVRAMRIEGVKLIVQPLKENIKEEIR